jgi:IstB-like ATP binding protein
MDKPGKTPCVSPTVPTGRRPPTSFTAPQQQQGMNLIPGVVKPSAGYRA